MFFQTPVLDPRALQGSPSATSKHGPSNTTLRTASIRGPPLIRLVGTRRHPQTPPQRDFSPKGLSNRCSRNHLVCLTQELGVRGGELVRDPPLLSSPVSPAPGAQAQTRDPLPHPSDSTPTPPAVPWGPNC